MKKILFTFLAGVLAVSAWAIDTPNQGFGIQIGWAQPILRLNNPSTSYPKDSLMDVTKLNGFKIGVVYDASYIAGFGSTIGINYTMAGGHSEWKKKGTVGDYPRSQMHTMYHELEIFVDWQYKFEVAKETYLMLYTGPSIQCGLVFNSREETQSQTIWGEIVTTTTTNNRYILHAANDDDSNKDLTRLNVTWGIGAGFQYQRYFVRGGYEFGLINPYANKQFINVAGETYDRYTRGRLDQWTIKIGMYFWYED